MQTFRWYSTIRSQKGFVGILIAVEPVASWPSPGRRVVQCSAVESPIRQDVLLTDVRPTGLEWHHVVAVESSPKRWSRWWSSVVVRPVDGPAEDLGRRRQHVRREDVGHARDIALREIDHHGRPGSTARRGDRTVAAVVEPDRDVLEIGHISAILAIDHLIAHRRMATEQPREVAPLGALQVGRREQMGCLCQRGRDQCGRGDRGQDGGMDNGAHGGRPGCAQED